MDKKEIYQKSVFEKFELIKKLAGDYNEDTYISFMIELSAFLDEFAKVYHLK